MDGEALCSDVSFMFVLVLFVHQYNFVSQWWDPRRLEGVVLLTWCSTGVYSEEGCKISIVGGHKNGVFIKWKRWSYKEHGSERQIGQMPY